VTKTRTLTVQLLDWLSVNLTSTDKQYSLEQNFSHHSVYTLVGF